jgi:hypothetical protein
VLRIYGCENRKELVQFVELEESAAKSEIRGIGLQGKRTVKIRVKSGQSGNNKVLDGFEGDFGFRSLKESFGSFRKIFKRQRMFGIKSDSVSIIICKSKEQLEFDKGGGRRPIPDSV